MSIFLLSSASYRCRQSLQLDGSSKYVTYDDGGALNAGSSFSAFIWNKGTGQADYAGYIGKYNSSSSNRSWVLQTIPPNHDKFRVIISQDGGGGTRKIYDSSTIALDGNWNLVGFTWHNSTLKLWHNAQEDTGVVKTQDDAFATAANSTLPFTLGAFSSADLFMQAKFGPVIVFNTGDLTASDIALLRVNNRPTNLLSHPKRANLLLWWSMSGTSAAGASGIKDDSGNSRHGTGENVVAGDFTTDVP